MRSTVLIVLLLFYHCYGQYGYFWHMTDLHWDFTYPTEGLSCTEKNVSDRGLFGNYLCDSPWILLDATLKQAKKIKPDVDFIIWTGDTPPHLKTKQLSTDIVIKILEYVTTLFKKHFPETIVYSALGNHDYYPKDLFPPHNNLIYNATYNLWKDWIGDDSQADTFLKGGYYTVKTKQGHRIVALNTNLYHDAETTGLEDPADQFAWLEDQLIMAATRAEKVVIIGHIPPGYSTPAAVCQYESDLNEKLVDILLRHSDVITAMHFGHEHHDSFRLVSNSSGSAVIPLFIAPSVTPLTWKGWKPPEGNHNPGARLIKYNRQSNQHLDLIQYYIDLPAANKMKNASLILGYTATGEYGIPDITSQALSNLVDKFEDPTGVYFKSYIKWFNTNGTVDYPCDVRCHKAIMCGLRYFKKEAFTKCFTEPVEVSVS